MARISGPKGMVMAFATLFLLIGCELDPNIKYYKEPKIENLTISHDLNAVTANDEIYITATATSFFCRGFVGVRYWVCTNDWGDTPPEMKFENEVLYKWIEPQSEEEEGSWKKLASLSHTFTYTCPSCGHATLTKPSSCTECKFTESKDVKFIANNVVVEENKPFAFEAVIPKQKAGKFVIFTLYCTSEYGIYTNTDYYSYTVQP